MNETVVNWVIEFLLRQKIDENIINGVISSLSPEIDDYRVRKTMFLRKIDIESSNGCISEKILELIEVIEVLDQKNGKNATNLMKNAYCLVAVDCTVRFLVENAEENEKYMEKVENLWRNRVCKSERLVSEALKRWFFDIEAAVENSEVYQRIWMRNTRNEALKAVREYLKEAWACLGPSFLESMAVKWRNESSEFRGVGGVVCPSNLCRDLVVVEGTEKGQASVRQKHVGVKGRSHKGPIISDAGEDATNKAGDGTTEMEKPKHATLKVDRAKKETRSNTRKRPLVDNISDDVQTAQTSSSTGPRGNNIVLEDDQMGPKILKSCEVVRVQRALRRKTRELRAAVNDPLPEALQKAQTLTSVIVTDNLEIVTRNEMRSDTPTIIEAERLQKAHEIAQKTNTDMNIDAGVYNKAVTENVNQDTLNGNSCGYSTLDHGTQKNVRKQSLMDPNDTSHTLEWDDEIENARLGSPSRPRLLSPKALRSFSPLQMPEYRHPQRRRERKMWTPLEENTLREGVIKYGRGNWKAILTDDKFRQVFQGRTEVDLKDKWRNLTR